MSKSSSLVTVLVTAVSAIGIGLFAGQGCQSSKSPTTEAPQIAVKTDTAKNGADKAAAPADNEVERYKVPITDAQPDRGKPDALVTIVEFSDFQCPFCGRVEPTVEQILKQYGDKVRLVWRNNPLPFHPNAEPAAQVAIEAFKQGGNDKFWAVHYDLFKNQRDLSRPTLDKIAAAHGLDKSKVDAAIDDHKYSDEIKDDEQLAARLGARGTPTFFINGRKLVGAQPLPAFTKIIDEEIATAEKLVKSGTPADKVYATLTANALDKAAPPKPAPNQPSRPQPDPNAVYKVPVTRDYPQRGPNDALVTIVEFSDFQCPFCGRVEPTIEKILQDYGKDVRLVWMNNPLPFHPNAKPSAIAAEEAFAQGGNKMFWKLHDLLFKNQSDLSRANIEKFGQEVGMNMAKLRAALDNDAHMDEIQKQEQLARSLGASGTPSFFINGRNLRGAQPYASFKIVIDQELAKAKKLVEDGTPRAKVYEKIIENGATKQVLLPGSPTPSDDQEAAADKVYKLPLPENAPTMGPKDAKVVIQEASDFQCPFCHRVNPTIEQLMKEYKGKVHLVWRDYPLPFHSNAMPAAEAAREVFEQGGNDKFWQYHDLLFANQQNLDRATLEKLAEQVGGINMAKFRAALDNNTHKKAIEAEIAAVQASGARIGTPAFFINGRLLMGAQPYSSFKAAVDKALADAS